MPLELVSYATPDEVRSVTGKVVNEDEVNLDLIIASVSRALDGMTNRPYGFVAPADPYVRTFSGSGTQWLLIDEAVEIDSISVREYPDAETYTAWETDTWLPFSGDYRDANFNGLPYTGVMVAAGVHQWFTGNQVHGDLAWYSDRVGYGLSGLNRRGRNTRSTPTVSISARWGYAEDVPDVVKMAAIVWAARIWKRGKSAFSDVLSYHETSGQVIYRLPMDPEIRGMIINARLMRVPV